MRASIYMIFPSLMCALLLVVNQHDYEDDLKNLKGAISESSGGTLVVLGDEGTPLSRVW